MPNIRTFDTPALGLQPTEIGVESTAAAARRGGQFFNQAAQALTTTGDRFGQDIKLAGKVATDYVDHQQIMTGAAHGTELFDALTKSKDQAIKDIDPQDPAYGQKVELAISKWREEQLNPALDKFREGFTTEGSQQWADHFINATRQHMFTSSAADVSNAAAIGIHNAIHTTINTASNVVTQDPSALKSQLDMLDHSLTGMVESSPIKGVESAKVLSDIREKGKEQIIKSAAVSSIYKTGQVPKWVYEDRFSGYINGAELKQFEKTAQAQQKADLLTDKQLHQYQKQQEADAAHTELSKNFTDSVTFDNNGKATIKPNFYKNIMEIEKLRPGAATERARAMIDWGQHEQQQKREQVVTDPKTMADLYGNMFNPDHPTTDIDILKAATEDKLSDHHRTLLMQMYDRLQKDPLNGPVIKDTIAAVKGSLGDSPQGNLNFAKFIQSFIPQYLTQSKTNTLKPNALDLRDESSLISQTLKPLKLTPGEMMLGHAMKNFGGETSSQNLGEVLGVETKNSSLRKVDNVTVPPRLNGIADLQRNKVTGQWRDSVSGKIYDPDGFEIKR